MEVKAVLEIAFEKGTVLGLGCERVPEPGRCTFLDLGVVRVYGRDGVDVALSAAIEGVDGWDDLLDLGERVEARDEHLASGWGFPGDDVMLNLAALLTVGDEGERCVVLPEPTSDLRDARIDPASVYGAQHSQLVALDGEL